MDKTRTLSRLWVRGPWSVIRQFKVNPNCSLLVWGGSSLRAGRLPLTSLLKTASVTLSVRCFSPETPPDLRSDELEPKLSGLALSGPLLLPGCAVGATVGLLGPEVGIVKEGSVGDITELDIPIEWEEPPIPEGDISPAANSVPPPEPVEPVDPSAITEPDTFGPNGLLKNAPYGSPAYWDYVAQLEQRSLYKAY